jgi:MFS family permease
MGTAEIGPLTLGEILDRMFSIYRKNFLLLIGIAGIPYAFLIVLGGLVAGILAATNRNDPSVARIGIAPAAGLVVVVAVIVGLIFLLGVIVASLGTYAAAWDIQVGRKPGIRRAYRVAWSHLGAAILAGILSFLAMAAGMFLLVIPGIIVWLALSLIYPVIVAEDSGGFDALNRSWELTKGYRWKIFVAGLVYFAVSMAITYGIQIPVILLSTFVFPQNSAPIWFTIISAFASILGSVLPAPLLAIASCLIYYDARVRKEGFDLQRLLDELPPGSAAPAAPGIAVS